ncbi:MAG: sulfite exporter TauE/SafE family protein [Syntrophomonas sp.]
MNDIITYALIGITAGLLSGFFGVAGGIVVIPALIYIAGFNQLTAQGTSLAILLPPVGLLAFFQYYKSGHVDVKAAVVICVLLFIGAFFGAKLAHNVPAIVLKKGFALMLLLASVKILFDK